MKKRLISILLSLSMVLTLLPETVLSAGVGTSKAGDAAFTLSASSASCRSCGRLSAKAMGSPVVGCSPTPGSAGRRSSSARSRMKATGLPPVGLLQTTIPIAFQISRGYLTKPMRWMKWSKFHQWLCMAWRTLWPKDALCRRLNFTACLSAGLRRKT